MNGGRPKVSVIIPCYNSEKFLAAALESALAQTFTDLEVIVVDDGSTDGTASIVMAYGDDRRVRYLYQKNQGLSVARNVGIEAAGGEFIAFLDSDDLWVASKIARQVELLARDQDTILVFTDYSTFDSSGMIASRKLPKLPDGPLLFSFLFSRNNFIYPSTVVLRRNIFHDVGYFDVSLNSIEDYDLWLRIVYKFKMVSIPEPMVKIRQHDSRVS